MIVPSWLARLSTSALVSASPCATPVVAGRGRIRQPATRPASHIAFAEVAVAFAAVSLPKVCVSLIATCAGAAAFLLLSTVYVVPANAQSRPLIDAAPSCKVCSLVLDHRVALVATPDQRGPTSESQSVIRNSRGEFVLAHAAASDEIEVFAPTGNFVRHVGTAEGLHVKNITRVVRGKGDTIQVLDGLGGARYVVGPDLTVVRKLGFFPGVTDALPLEHDQLLVSAKVLDAAHVGLPLHVIGEDGQVVKSFGATDPVFRPDQAFAFQRIIARSGLERIWSIHRTALVIEEWDLSGRKMRELEIHAPWFPAWSQGSQVSATEAPRSIVTAARTDGSGRLWLILTVAGTDWRKAKLGGAEGRGATAQPDFDDAFDSMVLVVDVNTAHVVAEQRFPQLLRTFCDSDCVVGYKNDGRSTGTLEAWRLRLVGERATPNSRW